MVDLNIIADKLVEELNANKIRCYIWHRATTGSVYIRFNDQRMGSVRLGDHEGRGKLKYKFNLRSDFPMHYNKWKKDENVWRHYLSIDQWRELIPILNKRKEDVKAYPEAKYEYKIPSFKK